MLILNHRILKCIALNLLAFFLILPAHAATAIPFNITMSEAVNVTGSPRIAVDVGGVTRYATYASGTGTSSLTFTYAAQAGDVDLDGVTLSSPIDLNGGTITDLNGNPETNLTFTVPNTSGIKIDYPSLSMDFIADADGRYTLNGTAYNDLPAFLSATGGTFSRNSVGTYYDSTGTLQTASANQPRFDHDPTTFSRKGLLLEKAFSNGLKTSENFSFATHWTLTNISLDSSGYTAPNGMTGATKIIANTNNAVHKLESTLSGGINVTSGVPITASVFVKAGESDRVKLEIIPTTIFPLVSGVQTAPSITVNLTAGTIITSENTTYSSITRLPNGWFRVAWGQTTMNANTLRVAAKVLDAANAQTFAGDGVSGLYLWGYQIVTNSLHERSYVPSNGSWGIHSADDFVIPTSAWYNSSSQTLLGRALSPGKIITDSATTLADINDNSWNERFQIRFIPTFKYGATISTASSIQATLSGGSYTLGQTKSLALTAQVNDTNFVADGSSIQSSNALVMSSAANQLRLGSAADGQEFLNGTIENFKYYPARISDTQLQLMTQ